MRQQKKSFWYKLAALFLLLALTVPVLCACGGGGEEETPTGTTIDTNTIAPTATPTPMSSGPVKIGAITSWSGAGAAFGLGIADPVIKLVEKQVKDMGGILGGREVTVVKYDNRASVAEATAGATKLFFDDKVSVLVFGGISGAEANAIATFADENEILFVSQGSVADFEKRKFSVIATFGAKQMAEGITNIVNKIMNARKIAILGSDITDSRNRVDNYKMLIEPTGAKVVYEQYAPIGTIDYTPYLTKIMYQNPDALILDMNATAEYLTVAKQIADVGGWGNIKVATIPGGDGAKKLAGAQGWYVLVAWATGLSHPGAVKFEQDYKAMYGNLPSATAAYPYNCLWTAIHAIELAGTDDPMKIGLAARSGSLEWETPMGLARYTVANGGYPGLIPTIAHIENNALVIVNIPE